MYIHLGNKAVVKDRSVIGIFDIDHCSISKRTREYLTKAQKSGQVINVTDELPKSFVVCESAGERAVYVSGVSTATIKKRAFNKKALSMGE